jgi:two-component system NtrC family sensor kinase
VAGKPIKAFAETPEVFEGVMDTCKEEGCAVALDVRFRNKAGSRVYCNTSLVDLRNREGERVGTVGICQDITQWKKLQQDLIQIDRLAEIGRIAAGVAHEINNPVAVIGEASGWAGEVIADARGLGEEDRRELEEVVSKIGDQTRRCRNITHKLLNFARNTAPAKIEFDVHEVVRETLSLLEPELKHTSIAVKLHFPDRPLLVKSDPRLLEQVLVNFITNAIHAVVDKAEGEGSIEIETQKSESYVEISVKDTGVGTPEEDHGKIFELFYTTKPVGKGTGLGLSICRNIIHNLGGEMTFESTVGVGAVFKVRIPLS